MSWADETPWQSEFRYQPSASSRDLDGLLRQLLGPNAVFRPGQREAVEAVLQHGARVLLVQATGWGKSAVYWLATKVGRDEGRGPTLIVSPLLALMRDQILAARRIGLRAETVNATNRDEWPGVRADLERDAVDVLLISPERLANDEFIREYMPAIQRSLGLLVVDEVHCISDWGHDFRPDYRRIAAVLRALPASVPVLGTTATANARVRGDVAEQFADRARSVIGPLARISLRLKSLVLADQAERLAWLARYLAALPGAGIVYCLTVADTERVAAWLRSNGIEARAYHASVPTDERESLEAALLRNEVKALVATVALGMGFDKPDLGFVVHFQRPGSVISYYQQVGRAGRAVHDADGILLSGREDDDIHEYFIRSAFPSPEQMAQVLESLAEVDSSTITGLESRLNLRRSQLAKVLKLLEVDGAVAREKGRYFRTASTWVFDADRVRRVTEQRYRELEQMREYTAHTGCLMEFLTSALDDPDARPCGRCMNCIASPPPSLLEPLMVQDAVEFLRRSHLPIPPRLRWPRGAVEELTGAIHLRNEPGWALSIYGDAGWGRAVAVAKYETSTISDDLIAAAVECIRDKWQPSAHDGWWVTSIPSGRRTRLVADAANAIAKELGLPYRDDVISKVIDAPVQKEMQNSAMQLRNAYRSLGIAESPLTGPVILIDDVVDSRWTFTVAGHLLRSHGSGPVYPFAFASAAGRDQ